MGKSGKKDPVAKARKKVALAQNRYMKAVAKGEREIENVRAVADERIARAKAEFEMPEPTSWPTFSTTGCERMATRRRSPRPRFYRSAARRECSTKRDIVKRFQSQTGRFLNRVKVLGPG